MESGSLTPLERKKLTPKQLAVWDVRFGEDPPLTFAKVAETLGISRTVATSRHSKALELLDRSTGQNGGQNLLEAYRPEKAAEAMAAISDPLNSNIAAIARDVGISDATAHALAKRMNGKFVALTRAMGDVQKDELRNLFADTAFRILTRISDAQIEEASLRDKMVAVGIATDKLLVLDGQPTQILSVKELSSLDALASGLLNEVKRRGLEVEVDPLSTHKMLTDSEPER